jgi:hypothetical protein
MAASGLEQQQHQHCAALPCIAIILVLAIVIWGFVTMRRAWITAGIVDRQTNGILHANSLSLGHFGVRRNGVRRYSSTRGKCTIQPRKHVSQICEYIQESSDDMCEKSPYDDTVNDGAWKRLPLVAPSPSTSARNKTSITAGRTLKGFTGKQRLKCSSLHQCDVKGTTWMRLPLVASLPGSAIFDRFSAWARSPLVAPLPTASATQETVAASGTVIMRTPGFTGKQHFGNTNDVDARLQCHDTG